MPAWIPLAFWGLWVAMLVIGDPLFIWIGGEKASDTHFLTTIIPYGVRIGILAWVAYHFLVQHVRG